MTSTLPRTSARHRILDVALTVIRTKGYAATTVDDLCAAAEVTKGAFFHHFASKEALAWRGRALVDVTSALFEQAPYHAAPAPVSACWAMSTPCRPVQGTIAEYTCLAGTMVQEVHASSPAIRDACARSITGHAATLEADIAEALAASPRHRRRPRGLALHTQAVLQGAFILAKATQDDAAAAASIAHLRTYLEFLFGPPVPIANAHPAPTPSERRNRMTPSNSPSSQPRWPTHRSSCRTSSAPAPPSDRVLPMRFGAGRAHAPAGTRRQADARVGRHRRGAQVMLVDEMAQCGVLSPKALGGTPDDHQPVASPMSTPSSSARCRPARSR
jgi:TetR/AcrR family transcriptional repressor of nem operon